MTQTSLAEIQTAIYSKFTGDATLMAMITGVFDFAAVSVDQSFPYITLGDATETPDNTFGRRGYDDTFTLHIWSSATGFNECYSILARMNYLLDQKALTLATQSHVGTWYEFSQPLNDPGVNSVRHVPVRYRFETQE